MVNTRSQQTFSVSPRMMILVIGIAILFAIPIAIYGSIELILIGLIGIAIAGVMLSRPQFTTLVVIFVFYTNLSVVAIRSGVPDLLATAFFLLLGLPLIYLLFVKKQPLIINSVLVMMVIYLGLILLSTILAAQPSASYSRVNSFIIEGLVLYALILNCIPTKGMLRKCIWTLIIAGGFIGALSAYQSVTGNYENDFGGLAQVSNAAIDAGPESFFGDQRTVVRLAGPVGEKNRYAQIMIVLLPLAVSRVLVETSKRRKLLAGVCGVLILTGTLLTFSRGAGIAIVVMVIALVPLHVIRFRYWLAVVLSIPALMFVFAPDYLGRLSTLGDVSELASGASQGVDSSLLGRATENLATLVVIADHPLIGVGPGQLERYIREASDNLGLSYLTQDRRGHNMYLEELADTGILAFSAFIGILIITVVRLYQLLRYWRSRNYDNFQTLAALLLAVIAYMTSAVFLHLSYARYYWFLLALAGAGIYVFDRAKKQQSRIEEQMLNEQTLQNV